MFANGSNQLLHEVRQRHGAAHPIANDHCSRLEGCQTLLELLEACNYHHTFNMGSSWSLSLLLQTQVPMLGAKSNNTIDR